MQRLDLPPADPAELLAADEVFLDAAEDGGGGEIISFWEPCQTFVVVGYANKIAAEVNADACAEKKIPIFRRCSGGGAVVQMAGGLNYSLILRIDENGPTRSITAANQFIMEKNRAAIEGEFRRRNLEGEISVQGHTDLAFTPHPSSLIPPKKFAGSSQRRRKNFLLFHGTLLLGCDLKVISELLLMPSLEPAYRAHRPHEDFVANLTVPPEKIKAALAAAWGAEAELARPPLEKFRQLAREKYSTREWNYKF